MDDFFFLTKDAFIERKFGNHPLCKGVYEKKSLLFLGVELRFFAWLPSSFTSRWANPCIWCRRVLEGKKRLVYQSRANHITEQCKMAARHRTHILHRRDKRSAARWTYFKKQRWPNKLFWANSCWDVRRRVKLKDKLKVQWCRGWNYWIIEHIFSWTEESCVKFTTVSQGGLLSFFPSSSRGLLKASDELRSQAQKSPAV